MTIDFPYRYAGSGGCPVCEPVCPCCGRPLRTAPARLGYWRWQGTIPLTVGDSGVVPLTVGGGGVVPLTVGPIVDMRAPLADENGTAGAPIDTWRTGRPWWDFAADSAAQ